MSATLGLIDKADGWIEDLLVANDHLVSIDDLVILERTYDRIAIIREPDFIACTAELDERGRFTFGDEFDISA